MTSRIFARTSKGRTLIGLSSTLLLATGSSHLALAQSAAPASGAPASQQDVEQIVVTTTRVATKLSEVPESVAIVSAEQIQDSPAQSLDDVLRKIPSVDLPLAPIEQIHPTSASISMRGLSGQRALVLLDDVPINDAFFGFINWARVPLEDIQQVEVVRGGDSTLWGDHAMGGVINIITKTPDKDEAIVTAGGGSFGTYSTNAFLSYVPSDKAKFSVDYGYNRTAGFESIPDNERVAIDVPTSDESHSVSLTGDFAPIDHLTAQLKFGYNEYDEFHQITRLSSNAQHIWNYSGKVSEDLGDGMDLTALAFHNDSHFWTVNTGTPPGLVYGVAEYPQNIHNTPVNDTGGSLVFTQSLPSWVKSYSVGLDLHQIDGSDTAAIYNSDGSLNRTDLGKGKQIFFGGFAQTTLKPIPGLDIQAAARYQYFEDYDGFVDTPGSPGKVANSGSYAFDPRISAKYAIIPEVAVRAAAYESFNAPTLWNLYRSYSTPTGVFESNPELKPEKLKGAETGFDFTFLGGDVTAQTTAYYNYITNLITSRNLTSAELPSGFYFGSVNINAGAAVSKGFEASTSWKVMPGLTANLGYTYAYSVISSNPYDPTSVGKQVEDVPRNEVTGSLSYVGGNGWRITPDVRWVGQTYGDNDHTLPLDNHFVMDLSAAYPFTNYLEGFVQMQNLFDRRYISLNDGGSPAQIGTPFDVFVGVRASFD